MDKLTKEEEELIAAIRNYRRGYPDSYPGLLIMLSNFLMS